MDLSGKGIVEYKVHKDHEDEDDAVKQKNKIYTRCFPVDQKCPAKRTSQGILPY